MTEKKKHIHGGWKALIIVVSVLVFIGLLVPVSLAVVTTPKVTNKLLAHFVPQFLRADVQVEKLDLRLFSIYPEAELELRQPVIRVSVPDSLNIAGNTMPFPHGDTLFTADTIRVRLRPLELLDNHLNIRSVLVSRPHIYLAQYDSTYNFDIVIPSEEPDTTPSQPMKIEWDQVRLTDGVICVASDSIGIAHLAIDSIFVASNGQFADSALAAYIDAGLRCEDARVEVKGFVSDSLDVQTHLSIPHIERLIGLLPDAIRQQTIKQNQLSGSIKADATAKGYYTNGQIPCLHASIFVDKLHGGNPQSKARLENLTLRAEAHYDKADLNSSFVRIDTLQFNSGKSWLYAHGQACYKKKREWVQLDLQSSLHLKELIQLAELQKRVRARGEIKADVSTNFFVDDLLKRRIYDIHSASTLQGDSIYVGIRELKTLFIMDSLRAEIKTNMARKSRRTGKIDTALLNVSIAFRQMQVKHRRTTDAKIDRTMLRLYADDLNDSLPPILHASLSLQGVKAQQYDTIRLWAKRMRVSASMRPDKERPILPTTTARLSMDSVFLANPRSGTMLDSVRINISTTPRVRTFRFNRATRERIPIPESEHKPVPVDSLLRLVNRVTQDTTPMEAFIRHFTTTGKVYVRRMGIRKRGDDLRPTVSRMDLTLNDDTVRLNSFFLRVGRSGIALKGEVQHLRRYLLRGRTLDANLTLRSRRLDLNQLANAFAEHQHRKEVHDSIAAKDNMMLLEDTVAMTDELAADSLMTDTLRNQLFVLPGNLNVTFHSTIDTVILSNMRLHQFTGHVYLKDHSLSITNMSTSTKVGKMEMNVRYTCKDTTEATAAAALRMDSVQVGELIHNIPQLDSIMPMLRSFDGSVASDLAAQCRLKSNMDVDLPSLNAGIWLRGEDLVLMDGETFSEIAKMLMFSKKTRNIIDSLSVEVLVKNNEVEIFPFMLAMDKYKVGVGGKQNLDGSFDYHISVFKPIQLGLDVYGNDFDHIRFKLVKCKYQSASTRIGKGGTLLRQQDANVIPSMQGSIRSYIWDLSKQEETKKEEPKKEQPTKQ